MWASHSPQAMAHALVFVLAPEALLPADPSTWEELQAAQRRGVGSGVALRLFRMPAGSSEDLDALVTSGRAGLSGADPFQELSQPAGSPPPGPEPPARRLICDAVVPHFDPRALWLGAYELEGPVREPNAEPALTRGQSVIPAHPADRLRIEQVRCLDRFPLREADNETCWFYPTENGDYLGWENRRELQLSPGHAPDLGLSEQTPSYQRQQLRLLWSLMADDQALTCVGLTYQRRRIEWPVLAASQEPFATWTSFRVDSMAEHTYQETCSITVFRS